MLMVPDETRRNGAETKREQSAEKETKTMRELDVGRLAATTAESARESESVSF